MFSTSMQTRACFEPTILAHVSTTSLPNVMDPSHVLVFEFCGIPAQRIGFLFDCVYNICSLCGWMSTNGLLREETTAGNGDGAHFQDDS